MRGIKRLIFLLGVMGSIALFGGEVPNEIIRENPKREVTTIESERQRDRATMSLKITKTEPELIKGILTDRTLTVVFPIKAGEGNSKNNKNIELKNVKLKVEAFSKKLGRAIPTKKELDSYTSEDIKRELALNKKIEKSFHGVMGEKEYILKIEGVNEDENIQVIAMSGEKIIKAYKVDIESREILEINSIGEVIYDIDKRFAENGENNWISESGARGEITGEEILKYADNMIEKRGNFNVGAFGTLQVVDVQGIEGREYLHETINNYKHFLKAQGNFEDEAVAPINIPLADYDKYMLVSKNNNFDSMLDNKFTIVGEDNLGNRTIIKGNAKENYIGNGVLVGAGVIDLTKVKNGRYFFPNLATGTSMEGKSPSGEKIIMDFILKGRNNAIDASGVVGGSKGKSIANIMKIEVQGEPSEDKIVSGNTLEVTFDDGNLVIGIDNSTGGLLIEKKGIITSKKVKLSYYFSPDLSMDINDKNGVKLGEFTLDIRSEFEFELDGGNILDFGKMIYDPQNLYHGASQIVKIKNPEGIDIDFSVEKDSVMILNGTPSKQLNIRELKVENIGDILEAGQNKTQFRIEGFAEVNKDTVAGIYGGEITVTVTLKKSKK